MGSMYYVGWVGEGGGGSQSYDIIASWGLGIGEIYVSVCKFSSLLLSQKRSYIKNTYVYITVIQTFFRSGYFKYRDKQGFVARFFLLFCLFVIKVDIFNLRVVRDRGRPSNEERDM